MFEVSLTASFVAGALTLLPSCGPLLLPAFFAYSFRSKSGLLLSSLLFILGFGLLFVPFGLGVNKLVDLLILQKSTLDFVVGWALVVFGVLSFSGFGLVSISLPKFALQTSKVEPFILGLFFGLTSGACSAPVLGAVLTLASVQTGSPAVFLLLLVFLLGMFVPLVILALIVSRFGRGKLSFIYSTGFTMSVGKKELRVFWSNFVSGLLFTVLGLSFLIKINFWDFFGSGNIADWFYHVNLWLLR